MTHVFSPVTQFSVNRTYLWNLICKKKFYISQRNQAFLQSDSRFKSSCLILLNKDKSSIFHNLLYGRRLIQSNNKRQLIIWMKYFCWYAPWTFLSVLPWSNVFNHSEISARYYLCQYLYQLHYTTKLYPTLSSLKNWLLVPYIVFIEELTTILCPILCNTRQWLTASLIKAERNWIITTNY